MEPGTPGAPVRFVSALSGHLDPAAAAEHVSERCGEALGGSPVDLAFLFVSRPHALALPGIALTIRRRLGVRCLAALSAEAIVGGEVELENAAGVSLLAARLPGVGITPFALDDLPPVRDENDERLDAFARLAGLGPASRGTFLFADPFSVPINTLLPAVARAQRLHRHPDERLPVPPVLGGLASAAHAPGENVLILNDRVLNSGGIGISLTGPIRVEPIVSQGCRGFGPTFIVTAAKGQIIRGLGGRPAAEALHQAVESLREQDRALLSKGLMLGRVVNEYKDRFGRDDFLIRAIMAIDRDSGALAVNDLLRVGQTVRFHLRDARTADEDLAMLLDKQKLDAPPDAALLFTCNGRGTRLFDRPHHDASAVARALSLPESGEERAKGGYQVERGERPPLPLAGFFAAGEIGPVGDSVFVHGHTACVAVFRRE
ncbi:MAG: FIST C-terminal domain-containing protein [Phycisphaerae bacterium]|nr:FIST C-terminal domain-containing protein [Phycisphaerae bacterium]